MVKKDATAPEKASQLRYRQVREATLPSAREAVISAQIVVIKIQVGEGRECPDHRRYGAEVQCQMGLRTPSQICHPPSLHLISLRHIVEVLFVPIEPLPGLLLVSPHRFPQPH